VTPAQVRKDLGYFGQFGQPGLGYRIPELIPEVRRILGTDKTWNVALVGVGNLGVALLRYKGFASHGFRIAALFDNNELLVGTTLEGIPVHHIDDVADVARREELDLAILCVPAAQAQSVAEGLVKAGIRGLFSFAPSRLTLSEEVGYVSIDLALELEQLSFAVTQRTREPNSS
jgi:redox-sensing transcriptional repressor